MNRFSIFNKKLSKGFTLIELLIVIAVLGVLASVVLVAIDPVQQLARGRDAGRKSSIGQLGRTMQAYYTTQSAYPTVAQWTAAPSGILVSSGEIKTFPTNPTYSLTGLGIPCASGNFRGYCYATAIVAGNSEVVIYARMESRSENSKCPVASPTGWFVFSSAAGRAGGVCGAGATEPLPGITTFTF